MRADLNPEAISADVLDLHLGEHSATEREQLAERVAADPALRVQNEWLCAALTALSKTPAPVASPDLAQRIKASVAAAPRIALTAPEPDSEDSPLAIIKLQSFRDIVAVAAVIVLAVGVGVPSLLHMRDREQRVECAANLASLGRAIQSYAALYGDNLPFVGWDQGLSWRPTTAPGTHVRPNRDHVTPLLQARLVEPGVLLCPGSPDGRAAELRTQAALSDPRSISYAYQNMAGARPSLRSDADLPILADDNPLFDGGVPLFDVQRLTGSASEQNSRAHRGAGQNLLTIDGRTRWTTTPNCGVGGDNIWTLNAQSQYSGVEGPHAQTDAHLLK